MINRQADHSKEARFSAVVFAFVVMLGWSLLCYAIVDVVLDYTLRRAGENVEFPPLHTPAFYWKCFRDLLWIPLMVMFEPYWLGGVSASICCLWFGLKIRSNFWRAGVALAALFGPIFAHGLYRIFVIY